LPEEARSRLSGCS